MTHGMKRMPPVNMKDKQDAIMLSIIDLSDQDHTNDLTTYHKLTDIHRNGNQKKKNHHHNHSVCTALHQPEHLYKQNHNAT